MEADDVTPQIAWYRSRELGCVDKVTLQHRAPIDAEVTLCGQRIPWTRVTPGDSRRCRRCDRVAARLSEERPGDA